MRRTLIVVVAGALTLGACGGGDDDDTATTTTEAPATTVERTTTTFEPEVAGLLTPPAGVTQEQADGFARDMVFALQDAGWPDLPRDTSVSLLEDGLGLGAQMCALADSTDPSAVEGAVTGLARQQGPVMSQALVDSGLPADQADELSGGFVAGMTQASGAQLCPQWEAEFSAAAEQYA